MSLTKKQQAREVLDSLESSARLIEFLAKFNALDILPSLSVQALQLAAKKLTLQVNEAQGALTIHVTDDEDID